MNKGSVVNVRRAINRYVSVGVFLAVVPIGVAQFVAIPEFVQGLCTGAGIALMLFGMFAANHGVERLRLWKRKLISTATR
jgi:hypothetical protein